VSLALVHLAIYGAVWWYFGAGVSAFVFGLAALLIWISVVDFLSYEIPDLAVLGLVVGGIAQGLLSDHVNWPDRAVGATLWAAMFWMLAEGFRRLRGFEGLGFGDVKLMVGLGTWLGFSALIPVVLLASVSGCLAVGVGHLWNRKMDDADGQMAIAFGPYLCLFAWVVFFAERAA
jgi:prepilin signal peptidase PulO-like enzyme (type II secretory pathway)